MSTLRPICVVFYPQSLLLPQFSLFFNVRDVAAVYSESASHIFEDPYVFEVHLAQIHVWLVVLDRLVHVGSDHLVGRRAIHKDIFRGIGGVFCCVHVMWIFKSCLFRRVALAAFVAPPDGIRICDEIGAGVVFVWLTEFFDWVFTSLFDQWSLWLPLVLVWYRYWFYSLKKVLVIFNNWSWLF